MIDKIQENITLIIGGSSSLGMVICNEFVAEGNHVIATYLKNRIPKAPLLDTYYLDLSSNKSIENFVLNINNSIIFNNIIFLSSVLPGNSLKDYKEEDFLEVMQINFLGQAKLMKFIIKFMNQNTNVLMMSSISGRRGSFDPIYAASKGAIIAFVKSMLRQIPQGARINAIAPSLVEDSKMFFDMKKERQNYHLLASPLGELVNLGDLAKIIFDLCQPHWRHVNGTCIDINGGVYV